MRLATLLLAALSGCSAPLGSTAAALKPIASPDGTMMLTPSVNQSKANATKHLCVAFDIHDSATGKSLHHVQSGASDVQKWAIGWFDDATIVVYSSDIGTCAWKLADDGSIAQLSNPLSTELNDFGDSLKANKYDH